MPITNLILHKPFPDHIVSEFSTLSSKAYFPIKLPVTYFKQCENCSTKIEFEVMLVQINPPYVMERKMSDLFQLSKSSILAKMFPYIAQASQQKKPPDSASRAVR